MIIEPKVRGFICTTAHPTGCAAHVKEQIDYVKRQGSVSGPKKVLVIGASTGYGLASRIVAAFGYQAQTIGVFYERPAAGKRTASAGWYNTVAFEHEAEAAGLYAKSINGDAFSKEIKQQTLDLIKQDWKGGVDLVIYSLASPRRIDPNNGEIYNSVLKPIGQTFKNKTIDVMTGAITEVAIEPATEDDIRQTVAVMGGDDWALWMEALMEAKLLAPQAMTVAYSYIGPELTYPVYRNGTIGRAKTHLEQTAKLLTAKLQKHGGGRALVSVNKGLVTQASAAIPVVPLYISLLYAVMKEQGVHEGCIEQMWRLFADGLYGTHHEYEYLDAEGRVRIDDLEMKPEIQKEVMTRWQQVNTENVYDVTDLKGYREDFYRLFGFEFPSVDYEKEVNPEVSIPSIKEETLAE
jgi:enoyl-[acyl-carrier protein] reductase/trans-2-enoyl-CoA reductase (NAD+)